MQSVPALRGLISSLMQDFNDNGFTLMQRNRQVQITPTIAGDRAGGRAINSNFICSEWIENHTHTHLAFPKGSL